MILRMLEKEPTDRWPSVGQAVAALESLPREREEEARSAMMLLARSGSRDRPRISVPISPVPTRGGVPSIRGVAASAAATRKARTLQFAMAGVVLVGIAGLALLLPLSLPKPRPNSATLPIVDTAGHAPLTGSGAAKSVVDSVVLAPIESKPADRQVTTVADSRSKVEQRRAAAENVETAKKKSASTDKAASTGGTKQAVPGDSPIEAPPVVAPTVTRAADGAVRIGSKIPNAVLYLNDKAQGFISGLRMLTLPATSIRIGIHVEGCASWDSTLVVPPGDTLRIGYRNPTCPP